MPLNRNVGILVFLLLASALLSLPSSEGQDSERALPQVQNDVPVSKKHSNYTLLGLAPGMTAEELVKNLERLRKEGLSTEQVPDVVLSSELIGLKVQGLGRGVILIRNPETNGELLRVFPEDDGTVGLLMCNFRTFPLRQGDAVVAVPGEARSEVKQRISSTIQNETPEVIICSAPGDNWLALYFFKNRLSGFALASPRRGPG